MTEHEEGMEATGGGVATADAPQEQPGGTPEYQEGAAEAVQAPLSDADRRYLARRNEVEKATQVVEDCTEDLAEKLVAKTSSNEAYKAAETALDIANKNLYHALKDDPDAAQGLLFDPSLAGSTATPSAPSESPDFAAAKAEWDKKWEAFQDQPIAVLGLTESLTEKLTSFHPSLSTLRALTEFKATSGGHGYTDIDGVGKGFADKIDDAYEKLLAAFMKANPQPIENSPNPAAAGADGASTGESSAPDNANFDYNFETTFPKPNNPTTHEEFADSYHIEIREDAIKSCAEHRRLKECLDKGLTDSLKPLTERSRASLEKKLGDAAIKCEDVFSDYAGTFGETAANALRRYVESHIEKKSKLKGGTE